MTYEEFKGMLRYRQHEFISDTEKQCPIEYKGYQAFVETVTEKESKQFFNEGKITLGDWILYSDLEIGPSEEGREDERLECTDSGLGLPYFDRVVQKYLYLKNSPDNLIMIGARHKVKWGSTKLYKGRIPTKFERDKADARQLLQEQREERRIAVRPKIKTIEHDYEKIKRKGKIPASSKWTRRKLINVPDFELKIFNVAPHFNTNIRNKTVSIQRRKTENTRYWNVSPPYKHHLSFLYKIKNYFIHKIEVVAKEKGYEFTEEERTFIRKIVENRLIPWSANGLFSHFLWGPRPTVFNRDKREGWRRVCKWKKPTKKPSDLVDKNFKKDVLDKPLWLFLMADYVIVHTDTNILDVVEFYRDNPKYRVGLRKPKKRR